MAENEAQYLHFGYLKLLVIRWHHRQIFKLTYCWWLKSQTTIWDVWNLKNNGKKLLINWCRVSAINSSTGWMRTFPCWHCWSLQVCHGRKTHVTENSCLFSFRGKFVLPKWPVVLSNVASHCRLTCAPHRPLKKQQNLQSGPLPVIYYL